MQRSRLSPARNRQPFGRGGSGDWIVLTRVRPLTPALDNDLLEFSEYFQQTPDGNIQVITYSYHRAVKSNQLIRRWDNTPHHPDLPDFPHHLHNGIKGAVELRQPVSIFDVLDEIRRQLNS